MSARVPLADAALKLSLSYQQARNMLMRGELKGGRDRYGRLYIEHKEVQRLLRERAVGTTRRRW